MKRTTPTRKPTPSHRRPRRAEPAAGSNDDVDGHEHEGAEPEINIDADAASRGTMPKPNSKQLRRRCTASLRHLTTPRLVSCLAATFDEPYGEQ